MNAEFGEAGRLDARIGWRVPHAQTVDDRIEQAKAGDAAAFEGLVERYRAQVFRTALRLLGNREDALDASQEVFLRMFKHLNTFDERKKFEPWLYTVTVNVCKDLYRNRSRRRQVPLEDAHRDRLETPPSAGRRADAAEERNIVEQGLLTLGEREREAIVLRDIEGLSTKEVAEVLGTAEVTVRSQISRARVKLKKFRQKVLGKDHEL